MQDAKKRLRREIRAEEQAMTREEKRMADAAIFRNIVSTGAYRSAGTVFCYVSTPHEADTSALLERILGDGKTLCVPLCTGDGIMEAREIRSLGELAPGYRGILEPPPGSRAVDPEEIDLAIIPCVSCSRSGERLGQGGGFYDRFAERYRGPALLVCRERLVRGRIPAEPHDAAYDTVVTDAGIFESRNKA